LGDGAARRGRAAERAGEMHEAGAGEFGGRAEMQEMRPEIVSSE